MMDASEIRSHQSASGGLYISNTWERYIKLRELYLEDVPNDLPSPDVLAVVLLSEIGEDRGGQAGRN